MYLLASQNLLSYCPQIIIPHLSDEESAESCFIYTRGQFILLSLSFVFTSTPALIHTSNYNRFPIELYHCMRLQHHPITAPKSPLGRSQSFIPPLKMMNPNSLTFKELHFIITSLSC